MTSCPLTPHPRSLRFRSAVEVVELAYLVLVGHRDLPGLRVIRVLLALPDLRATLVNADLPDQKALVVFRVLLDPLVAELEEPRYLAPRVIRVLPDLLGLKVTMVFRVLLDPLVPLEQMDNQDQRAMSVPLDLPDHKDLPDLQESVVPLVRMRSPLSSTGISPRMRQPRPTARRLMSKTHSDRPTHLRTVLGTTPR